MPQRGTSKPSLVTPIETSAYSQSPLLQLGVWRVLVTRKGTALSVQTALQRDCSWLCWCLEGSVALIIVASAAFSLYLCVATSRNPSVQTALQRDCSRLCWCLEGSVAVTIVATAAFSLYLCVTTSENSSVQMALQRDCSRLCSVWQVGRL